MSNFEIFVAAAEQGRALSDSLPAWLNFLASVIAALAWPGTVIVLVLLLRKHIPQLLSVLKRFRGPGFEAEFERQVATLAFVADQTGERPSVGQPIDIPIAGEPETADEQTQTVEPTIARALAGQDESAALKAYFRSAGDKRGAANVRALTGLYQAKRLAAESPYAAVVVAWKEVSTAMRDAAEANGIPREGTDRQLVKRLLEKEILSPETATAIFGLRQLRNRLTHEPDFRPDQDAVRSYIEVAAKVIGFLDGSAH